MKNKTIITGRFSSNKQNLANLPKCITSDSVLLLSQSYLIENEVTIFKAE